MKNNEKNVAKINKADLAKALRIQSQVRAGLAVSPIGPHVCWTCGLALGAHGT